MHFIYSSIQLKFETHVLPRTLWNNRGPEVKAIRSFSQGAYSLGGVREMQLAQGDTPKGVVRKGWPQVLGWVGFWTLKSICKGTEACAKVPQADP